MWLEANSGGWGQLVSQDTAVYSAPACYPQLDRDSTITKASTCPGWQALVGTTGSWEWGEWKGIGVWDPPFSSSKQSAHAESSGQIL